MQRLTQTRVDKLELPAGKKQFLVFDSEVRGLAVRVTATAKTWVLDFRLAGRQHRKAIGRCSELAVGEARTIAVAWRQDIAAGLLPRDTGGADRSMAALWQRYKTDYLPKLAAGKSQADARRRGGRIVKRLGGLPVAAITYDDCASLHRSIAAPVEANRTLELLRRLLTLARRWGWRSDNPAGLVETNREFPREEYLEPNEIERLLAALPQKPAGDAIRLLLLTGARPCEVLQMRWRDINLTNGIWTKPAATTKQRRLHRIPLSATALAIVTRQAAGAKALGDTAFVFQSSRGRPIKSLRKTWLWALKRAGLPHHRLYESRHSFASLLASRGETLAIVGALLGHSVPATTARYAHFYDEALRGAVDRVQVPAALPDKSRLH